MSIDASGPHARYHRQMLLPFIGEQGQARLQRSHALLVGCGALGCAIGDLLVRAGVGTLTIVDRDTVEITNLQRQVLFDEDDVREGTPKAEAAKARLQDINQQARIHAHVADFNHQNADRFAAGADLILDGLDNFETRYLLNDLAVARGLPYVYGGAVGMTGASMCILPHSANRQATASASHQSGSPVEWPDDQSTPCLRCVFPEAPSPGVTPTCDTAGVLGPVVMMIAAHQAAQSLKILTGALDALDRSLLSIDLWQNEVRRFDVREARQAECLCCGRGVFEFLRGDAAASVTTLCGRDAIQILPAPAAAGGHSVDLELFARRLQPHGSFTQNRFLLRGLLNPSPSAADKAIELTLFSDGRAVIRGAAGPDEARSIYSRFIGM